MPIIVAKAPVMAPLTEKKAGPRIFQISLLSICELGMNRPTSRIVTVAPMTPTRV